jgi:hypothetical protein
MSGRLDGIRFVFPLVEFDDEPLWKKKASAFNDNMQMKREICKYLLRFVRRCFNKSWWN